MKMVKLLLFCLYEGIICFHFIIKKLIYRLLESSIVNTYTVCLFRHFPSQQMASPAPKKFRQIQGHTTIQGSTWTRKIVIDGTTHNLPQLAKNEQIVIDEIPILYDGFSYIATDLHGNKIYF